MVMTIILISIIGIRKRVPFNTAALVTVICLISIFAFYNLMHPIALLILYGFLAIFPLMVILIKKNLFNGLLLWFVFVLFNYFGKISLPKLPDIKPERLVWVSIFGIFLSEIVFKKRKNVLGIGRIEIAMFLLSVLILVSMINAETVYVNERGLALSTLLSGFVVPFSIFFLAKNIVDEGKKIRRLFIFFSIIGLYLGLTGIFEHFKMHSLVFPSYIYNPNVGIHLGRSRGPFLNAGTNGMVICTIFFMVFYLLKHDCKKWMKVYLGITMISMLITLLFTFTRSAWLSFIVSVPIIPIFFRKTRVAFACAVFALILIIPVYKQLQTMEGSSDVNTQLSARHLLRSDAELKDKLVGRAANLGPVYLRLNLYGAAWWMFLEKPFFGFGFGTFKEASPAYWHKIEGVPYLAYGKGLSNHDTLAGILVELGLIGLSLVIFIIVMILRESIKLYHSLPSEGFLAKKFVAIFWGMFIIFGATSQFMDTRLFIFSNSLFFMMAGIIAGMYQRYQIYGRFVEDQAVISY